MINTPGSIIEDRQYELLLKNVSIFTGNWDEILQFTCPANVNIQNRDVKPKYRYFFLKYDSGHIWFARNYV